MRELSTVSWLDVIVAKARRSLAPPRWRKAPRLGLIRGPEMPAVTTLLRPIALAGFLLALACGLLLFVAQTGEYLPNRWFQIKMALLALALANALWHLRARPLPGYAALASLLLWPAILICGRMIGYS
jgi:hypothetical protein